MLAMKERHGSASDAECDVRVVVPSLSAVLPSMSVGEFQCVQQSDPSLKELFNQVLSPADISSAACGYFLQNGLLYRKWVTVCDDIVDHAVFQLAVPTEFHSLVLKAGHNKGGHFGVRKPYLNVLKYFFWPHIKRDVAAYIRTCHVC